MRLVPRIGVPRETFETKHAACVVEMSPSSTSDRFRHSYFRILLGSLPLTIHMDRYSQRTSAYMYLHTVVFGIATRHRKFEIWRQVKHARRCCGLHVTFSSVSENFNFSTHAEHVLVACLDFTHIRNTFYTNTDVHLIF